MQHMRLDLPREGGRPALSLQRDFFRKPAKPTFAPPQHADDLLSRASPPTLEPAANRFLHRFFTVALLSSQFRVFSEIVCMLGILVAGGAVERRSFVVKEQKFIRPIRCGKCGGNAHLTRRSPDQVRSDGSEVRVFECYECGHQTLRLVKA